MKKISEFLQFAKTVQHLTGILVVTILVSIISKNEKGMRMLRSKKSEKRNKEHTYQIVELIAEPS